MHACAGDVEMNCVGQGATTAARNLPWGGVVAKGTAICLDFFAVGETVIETVGTCAAIREFDCFTQREGAVRLDSVQGGVDGKGSACGLRSGRRVAGERE